MFAESGEYKEMYSALFLGRKTSEWKINYQVEEDFLEESTLLFEIAGMDEDFETYCSPASPFAKMRENPKLGTVRAEAKRKNFDAKKASKGMF